MASGTWKLSLSSSKYNYSDDYVDEYEEIDDGDDYGDDGDDGDVEVDYPCPFCTEDFDIVGLCCHIEEEHYDEVKKGVCLLCGTNVGVDLVEHVVLEHENVHKSRCKSGRSDGDSQSTLALIRKELLERSLKSLIGSSSSTVSSSNAAVDQMLTSFIGSYSTPSVSESKPSSSSADVSVKEELMDENLLERSMKRCVISDEKTEEQAQRCKFVQSLVLSTFLDDGL